MSNYEMSASSPSTTRIDMVDALRGFAIMGILLLHSIEHFNFYVFPENSTQSEWMIGMNDSIWKTMFFIFGSKAYGIFALLFGFTFHLQYSKQASKGFDFGPRFLWRMLILFGFGWINSILFPGEILLLYAIIGPFLVFTRKWNDKAVLALAIICLIQPVELYQFLRSYFDAAHQLPNYHVNEYWGATMDYMKEGSVLTMITHSWTGFKMMFFWSWENGRVVQTLGLFSMGIYFGRKHLFDGSNASTKKWLIILAVSIPVFLILNWAHLHASPQVDEQFRRPLRLLLNVWKNLFQLGAMISLFSLLYKLSLFQKLTFALKAYGRMSLSNYIIQSLIGGILYYPIGFHLAVKVNVTYSLLLGFVLFFAYVTFSHLWLKHFKQGPLEMLWHHLTWWPKARAKTIVKKSPDLNQPT